MDQWNLSRVAAHQAALSQLSQQQQPNAKAETGFGSNSYAAGGAPQQLQWSRASAQIAQQVEQQQSVYGSRPSTTASIPASSGGGASTISGQYGGLYGSVYGSGVQGATQQVSGAAGSRASAAFGAAPDRSVGSGASFIGSGASVNASGIYGGDAAKYNAAELTASYAVKGSDYSQSLSSFAAADSQADAARRYQLNARYPEDYLVGDRGAVARVGATPDLSGSVRGLLSGAYGLGRTEAEAGLLSAAGGLGVLNAATANALNAQQQATAYGALAGNRALTEQLYLLNASSLGYGNATLPPAHEFNAGRVAGGSLLLQSEGSYGLTDRPSIGSSRFDKRQDDKALFRESDRRHDDDHWKERERSRERERERELERERERDRDRERERARERDRQKSRERERERERDRRDVDRKREKSPSKASRKLSSPIKREERKKSPRHVSPTKGRRRDYLVKIQPYSLFEVERDYFSVAKRYSKLHVVPDFSKLVACWMGKEEEIMNRVPISFEHDTVELENEDERKEEMVSKPSEQSSVSKNSEKGITVWKAKVMLMSGISQEAYTEFLSDTSDDKVIHFAKLLKFVALRKDRNAIMAAGGTWDKVLDGGDPSTDPSALVRTAVRSLKEAIQLDLTNCTHWLRFVEIHYERVGKDGLPSHKEVTVIFLPDLSECLPSKEEWHRLWSKRRQKKMDKEASVKKDEKPLDNEDVKESDVSKVEKNSKTGETGKKEKDDKAEKEEKIVMEEKKEKKGNAIEGKNDGNLREEPPAYPGILLTTKRSKSAKMRSMTISLDGLLDYVETDREEFTFELSLFAEIFQEMLHYMMGKIILSNLESVRCTFYALKSEAKKRGREENKVDKEKSSKAKKKPRKKQKQLSDKTDSAEAKKQENAVENGAVPVKTEKHDTDDVQENTCEAVDIVNDEKGADSSLKEEVQAKDVAVEAKNEESKSARELVVNKELLKAYRYFDKNRVGYLKGEDMRYLLQSLGLFLSQQNVKDLVLCAVSETNKAARDEHIKYMHLVQNEYLPLTGP